MIKLADLSINQLNRIIAIKEQIETLREELSSVNSDGSAPTPKNGRRRGARRLSAAGRAAIIAGVKARWAKGKGKAAGAKKRDRRSSPAVRARLAAAARARWAKVKAQGKNTL
jgi:hypothetical protein